MPELSSWDGVTAVATSISTIAIVVTAVIAGRTLSAAREDSRQRTRPVLVAELRREHLSKGVILLVMRNIGQSVARDVTVSFDPPLPEASTLPDSDMRKWIADRFRDPVPTWGPGWSTSNVLRAGVDDELDPLTVTFTYNGPDTSKLTTYTDVYALEPDPVLKETSSTPSKTDEPTKIARHALEALQALVRILSRR